MLCARSILKLSSFSLRSKNLKAFYRMKLKKTAAETSLAPVARTLKSCSSRLYPWIMSSNETCAPSPPCSFSSIGSNCSCLNSLRRLVQASRVNLSFSFFHEANRLSNATWKSSKRKKSHHVISGREARKCTKYNINPIPATWGGGGGGSIRPLQYFQNRSRYGHQTFTDCRIYWQNPNIPQSTY